MRPEDLAAVRNAGFTTVASASDVRVDPAVLREVGSGSGLLVGRAHGLARVLVDVSPSPELLNALEVEVDSPVLLEVTTSEVLAALRPTSDGEGTLEAALTLAGTLEADGLLLTASQPPFLSGPGPVRPLPGWERPVPLPTSLPRLLPVSGRTWRLSSVPHADAVVARRVLPAVPDVSALSLPVAAVQAASESSGALLLLGGPGSGRTTVGFSLLLRALRREGAVGAVVADPPEFDLSHLPVPVLVCSSPQLPRLVSAVLVDLPRTPEVVPLPAGLLVVTADEVPSGWDGAVLEVSRTPAGVDVREVRQPL